MVNIIISILLVIAGIIHVLPIAGVLGADRLTALYGLSFEDPNLAILMRHRAVLFALLGAFLLWAAIKPDMQLIALVAGLISVISFLYLGWSTGAYNDGIRNIMIADLVALVCLIGVAGLIPFRPVT